MLVVYIYKYSTFASWIIMNLWVFIILYQIVHHNKSSSSPTFPRQMTFSSMLALYPRHKAHLNPRADEQHHPPAGHSHGRLCYHDLKCILNHHMALNPTQHMHVYELCALSALYNFELAWVGGVKQQTGPMWLAELEQEVCFTCSLGGVTE